MGYREKYFSKNDAYDNNNGWYRCVKCGRSFRKGDMDIDHIIPQKYGGSDRETNLQCICKHCNRSKQASMKDTPKQFKNMKRLQEDMKMRYFDAPDLKDVGKNAYRFINAVSDFATHADPLRRTKNYKENMFAKTVDGNPLIDRAYQLMLSA